MVPSFLTLSFLVYAVTASAGAVEAKPKCNAVLPGIYTNFTNTFDCPSTTKRNPTTCEMQTAMADFANLFYIQKNVAQAFDKYVAGNYQQHNPTIGDGKTTAVNVLGPIFSSPSISFKIARIMVGPEYTVVHVKRSIAGQPDDTIMDAYRTIGTCVVEHWDAIQPAIIDKTTVNPHPYF